MGILCKSATRIINRRLIAEIKYHGSLHGLRTGCGTGTAILEAKLLHQLAAMRGEVHQKILFYLQKAYDSLDWYQCLDILVASAGGPRGNSIPPPLGGIRPI